jgi:hypothetical protein
MTLAGIDAAYPRWAESHDLRLLTVRLNTDPISDASPHHAVSYYKLFSLEGSEHAVYYYFRSYCTYAGGSEPKAFVSHAPKYYQW